MSKIEWGTKRTCQQCNAKFYDLNKSPINCPKCHQEFDPEATQKRRRGRPPLTEAQKSKPKVEEFDILLEVKIPDVDVEIDDADLAEDLLEEDADFGEEPVVPTRPRSDDE
ncbi:TIGR02300 family protein [Candidatus Bealeia paramacronuclearis]|uniref:TIGR02300 family protein n=1 Tax=Candidatus Bealeia paramacronuclearis TaxID=1921001 RepID=A0ABZ2C5N3_9PROT|nr:hypothetical protein [Candidatus Bealeia paramacronuclearis]